MKSKFIAMFLSVVFFASLVAACSSDHADFESNEVGKVEFSPATRALAENIRPAYIKYTADMMRYTLAESLTTSHLALSPLSATMLLAQIANGVDEQSKKEIIDYLGTDDLSTLNEMCKTLLTDLPKVDKKVTLDIANSLWMNEFYNVSATKEYVSLYDYFFK